MLVGQWLGLSLQLHRMQQQDSFYQVSSEKKPMQIFQVLSKLFPNYSKEAEQSNGRLAMIGFFALIHNYALTGWIIPGIF